MGLPLAISPSQRSPGLGLAFDFLASPSAPGAAPLRALVIAPAASNGTITSDTQLAQSVDVAGAGTFLGQGTPGHLAIAAIFAELKNAQVDLVAPTASLGATATGTVAFSVAGGGGPGPVTSPWTVTVTLAGREVSFVWGVGESGAQGATKLVAALSAIDANSPVTPTNGGGVSSTATLTSKLPGQIGNDITFSLTMTGGAGGSITPSGSALAGGTLEPVLTSVLSLILAKEYTYIVLVGSNNDATSASSSSNVQLLLNQINANDSGTAAKLQQAIIGCTSTLSAAMAGTAKHDTLVGEQIFCNAAQSLPCEWAGAECGARLREVALNPVKNRINMNYKAILYGPPNVATQALTAVQEETALLSGVTPVTFDATGNPRPARPITMYFQDSNGAPDDRVLDVSRVDGLYAVGRDLRTVLPQQYGGKNITANLPSGADSLPGDVVEISNVREFVISRLRAVWVRNGVLDSHALEAAIGTTQNPGSLVVQIDETDDSQVDMVLPLKTVPLLAKMSVVIQQSS